MVAMEESSYTEKLWLLKTMMEDTSVSKTDKKKFYDKAATDTAYFARVFLGHIVKKVPDFHKDIYQGMNTLDANEEQQFFGGIIFRGAAKSTIKNIHTIKAACNQIHPLIYMVSETEKQAIGDLRSIADEFETNELIQMFYFNNKKPKGSIWNAGYIELSNGVAIVSAGFYSAHRGFKHKNQRPTLVIFDDFESKNNLATEEARQQVKDIVEEVIIPMGATVCKYIFLNTIVSPLSYMQRQYDLWKEGRGLFAEPQGKLVKKELTYFVDGVEYATWEEEKPMSWVKRKKQMFIDSNNLTGWFQEYYNIPKEESDPCFNLNFLNEIQGRFVRAKYVKYIELKDRRIPVNTFLGVDPAIKLTENADDTCIFVIGMDKNRNIYILDIIADKIEETKKPMVILNTAHNYKIDAGVIETYGYQHSLFEWTKEAMMVNNMFFTFMEFANNNTKKKKNKKGLAPFVNEGRTSYLKGCPHFEKFKSQMEKFSGDMGGHDDLVDGFFLSTLQAYPCQMGEEMIDHFLDKERDEAAGKKSKRNLNWRTA